MGTNINSTSIPRGNNVDSTSVCPVGYLLFTSQRVASAPQYTTHLHHTNSITSTFLISAQLICHSSLLCRCCSISKGMSEKTLRGSACLGTFSCCLLVKHEFLSVGDQSAEVNTFITISRRSGCRGQHLNIYQNGIRLQM